MKNYNGLFITCAVLVSCESYTHATETISTTCISPNAKLSFDSTEDRHHATLLTYQGQDLLGEPRGKIDRDGKILRFRDRENRSAFFKEYVVKNFDSSEPKFEIFFDMRGMLQLEEEGTCSSARFWALAKKSLL